MGQLISLADPFLAPGGRLVTLKGGAWQEELAAGLPPALKNRYVFEETDKIQGPPGAKKMALVVGKKGG